MAWKVTSGPASEPLSRSEVKTWLKVDSDITEDDSLIDGLITSARKHVERYTGLSLLSQTIQETFDGFPLTSRVTPHAELRLSVSPLISVTSVIYLNSSNESATVDSSNYVTDNITMPARIAPTSGYTWPDTYDVINAVTVTYTAGHLLISDANFPSEALEAMKLWIAHKYDKRQDHAKRYKDASKLLMDKLKVKYYRGC